MVGVSAPSQADSLFALVDLLQKPELQDRLKAFKEAEAAAIAARQEAEKILQEIERQKTDLEEKIKQWADIQPAKKAFEETQSRHHAWIDGIKKAIGGV